MRHAALEGEESFRASGGARFVNPATTVGEVLPEPVMFGACFLPGTLIQTQEGLRAIERLAAGEWVAGRSEASGKTIWRRVVQTFRTENKEAVAVKVRHADGQLEEIQATTEHPFYVEGKKWCAAHELKAGDQLVLLDGSYSTIVSVASLPGLHTVYNFEVEVDHTYFVGGRGVWVHNTSRIDLDWADAVNREISALRKIAVNNRIIGAVRQANGAAELSAGAALRQKYGHISVQERQAMIFSRTEEIARKQLSAKTGGHFMERHAPSVPLRAQLVSAATGLRPDGRIMMKGNNPNKRFAVDSTQFYTNREMLYGINRAERIQQHAIKLGQPIDGYITFKFSDFVGGGFVKNTSLFGVSDLSRFYGKTLYANFGIDTVTGRAITAYPVLSRDGLGDLY